MLPWASSEKGFVMPPLKLHKYYFRFSRGSRVEILWGGLCKNSPLLLVQWVIKMNLLFWTLFIKILFYSWHFSWTTVFGDFSSIVNQILHIFYPRLVHLLNYRKQAKIRMSRKRWTQKNIESDNCFTFYFKSWQTTPH